eukprot:3147164-Ditylum_brightwellii.AAC.1
MELTTLTVLTAPPCSFFKPFKSRVKIGFFVVVVDLAVAVILAVFIVAAMASLALAKHLEIFGRMAAAAMIVMTTMMKQKN